MADLFNTLRLCKFHGFLVPGLGSNQRRDADLFGLGLGLDQCDGLRTFFSLVRLHRREFFFRLDQDFLLDFGSGERLDLGSRTFGDGDILLVLAKRQRFLLLHHLQVDCQLGLQIGL